MKIVTKLINEDNIKELREVFHTLDSTNSGFITCSDVKRAVSNLGYKHEADEIAKIVNEVDYLS